MPATFPPHAAAVLPLKLWRPGWFDGVALVVGSAAPDAAYVVVGFVSLPETHTVPALLWFCLPVALIGCLVIRWAAPAVAAHLPAGGPLDLRAYGVLGVVRHPWYVTVSSILVGASTHLVWDGFTHAPASVAGWAIRLVPVLDSAGPFGLPWWRTLQYASSALGTAAVVGVAWCIGRTGALRRWHGDPPPLPRSPGRFWGATAAVFAACLAVMSAVLGGASHLVFDAMEDLSGAAEPALHLIGAVATVSVAVQIGRHRMIRRWHAPAPQVSRMPVLFWGVAAIVAAPGFIVVPMLPAAFLAHTTGARLITVVSAALLVAAGVVSMLNIRARLPSPSP